VRQGVFARRLQNFPRVIESGQPFNQQKPSLIDRQRRDLEEILLPGSIGRRTRSGSETAPPVVMIATTSRIPFRAISGLLK
jgi:hypothetical protein